MLIETLAQRFRKARVTNATDSSLPTRVSTLTRPSGAGNAAAQTTSSIHDLRGDPFGSVSQNSALIVPYATASDNNTFAMRILGWRAVGNPAPSTPQPDQPLWVPVVLAEVTCTCTGAQPGVAGGIIGTAELFADTIALVGTTGNANVSIEIVSPADDASIAHIVVDMKGFSMLELVFGTGGVATSCNALLAMM